MAPRDIPQDRQKLLILSDCFPCVYLPKKDNLRETDKQGRTSEARDKNISIFKFKSSLYPSPIYSLCLQKKSELKDPKHVRQEMSKAGKRMWAEKEWILGLSQSK